MQGPWLAPLVYARPWPCQRRVLRSRKFARVFGAIDSPLGSKLYPKKSKPLAIRPPMVSNGTTLLIYEEIELKFFYRSWVHGEYINKIGYEKNLITHCFKWWAVSGRTEDLLIKRRNPLTANANGMTCLQDARPWRLLRRSHQTANFYQGDRMCRHDLWRPWAAKVMAWFMPSP